MEEFAVITLLKLKNGYEKTVMRSNCCFNSMQIFWVLYTEDMCVGGGGEEQ